MTQSFLHTPTRQRGMATIFIVLLAGLAITTTTLGVMYQVRSTQDQQMAVHASTQSESLAWTGVELVRLYLEQQTSLDDVTVGVLSVSGVDGLAVNITAIEDNQVTASITGSTNLASTTLQAVYTVTIQSSNGGGGRLSSSLTWNGDVNYSGGSLTVTNGSDLANVAINGNLTISSGAQASVSGCATGNISLSGGGVSSTSLSAEGNISISSMSSPSGISVWAKNIYITQDGGSYNAIKAGAFTADIVSNGSTIGTAITGGSGMNSSGAIIPLTSGTTVLTLSDGTVYTLDLEDASQSGGVITTTGAVTRISGSAELPATISLIYSGTHGGTIEFKNATVAALWGNTATLSGWSGTYTSFKTHGDANVINPTITSLLSGGSLWATQAGCSGSNCWSMPSVTSGTIAGHLYYGGGKTLVADSTAISGVNVSRGQTGTDPGLPGVPYCNVQANPVDVSGFRDVANYVFYFDDSTPMLKIQNVKNASGTSIDGTYNILTTDLRTLGGLNFMQCNWYSAHCLRNATPTNGWTLTGIYRFPSGVLWFYGDVTIDGMSTGTQPSLYNGILTTGDITLTSSGHGPLYAPNFATPAVVCNGNFYPSNLCDKSSGSAAFATWTDSSGTVHTGLPLGNVAIAAQGDMSTSGWTIHGHVMLGGTALTNGAKTTIYGGLSVGGNTVSDTLVSQGGLEVNTSSMTEDQTYVPTGDESSSSGSTTTTATVRWVRTL
ncbi:hypothetical protein [Phytopseudomonas dryadis]|uniref:Uncharacterized protein n=1 Tax=Phytopseudomonas dryadis TaxID=2487520 RepID=A0A4Q9R5X4_9GAMM|nr:hypothetical protein [Pseudomonas dryadis]TBU95900.1 hypothetical protein DNK44_06110 [Pseudomonas dryadis]